MSSLSEEPDITTQSYLAGDVGGVTVQHGAVAVADLPGVVQHDHLGGEVGNAGGRLVLGVGSDVASPGKVIV